MSYHQLYRNTTLGETLQETLDEMITNQLIAPNMALKTLLKFDQVINNALAHRVKTRVHFTGGLSTYRYCDNVWTLVLTDVEFRESSEQLKMEKLKIVACESKATKTTSAQNTSDAVSAALQPNAARGDNENP